MLGYCLKPVDIQYLQKLLRQAVQNIRREVSLQADTLLDYMEEGEEGPLRRILWKFGFTAPELYLAVSVRMPGRRWKPGSPSVWESVNTCICVKNPSPGMRPAVLSGKAGKKAASAFRPLPYPLAS